MRPARLLHDDARPVLDRRLRLFAVTRAKKSAVELPKFCEVDQVVAWSTPIIV
jgi:hypothetical protein